MNQQTWFQICFHFYSLFILTEVFDMNNEDEVAQAISIGRFLLNTGRF